MAYLLDSDVFIRAKNDHYGFDFCSAFWAWLARAAMTASCRASKPYTVNSPSAKANLPAG